MKYDYVNISALKTAVLATVGEETTSFIEKLYEVINTAQQEAFEEGYRAAEFCSDGDDAEGWSEGYDAGYEQGYDNGFADGEDSGHQPSFDFDGYEKSDKYLPKLEADVRALDEEMKACDAYEAEMRRVSEGYTSTFPNYHFKRTY